MSWDHKALVSAAKDGTININKLDYTQLMASVNHSEAPKNEVILSGHLVLDDNKEESADILDDNIYSIQQAKLLAEQDSR